MDLTKLSDQDLVALKAGDYSKMSDAGLAALKGEKKTGISDAINNDAISRGARDLTSGMSGLDKFRAGAGKAVYDTGQGIAQLFGAASNQDVEETRKRDAQLMDSGAGMAGNIAGNVGMALAPGGAAMGVGKVATKIPYAARLGEMLIQGGKTLAAPKSISAATGVGAAQGVIQPSTSGGETALNVALGGAMSAAPGAIARGMSPQTSPEVRALMQSGVSPTVGQIMGGTAKGIEDKLTSVPLVGDMITSARRGSVEDLNRAVYARALDPIGGKTPKNVGRDGVADVSRQLGGAYDAVLPKIQFGPDADYMRALADALQNAKSVLPDAQNAQLGRIFDAQIAGKAMGTMSGTELKPVQSELGRLSRLFEGDPSVDTRNLGGAVSDLNQATRDAMIRQNPAESAVLGGVDQGYKNYTVLRDAAARTGSKNGVFSPEALQAAVRAGDKSVGKGNFARGGANMQDLSDAAVDVLGRGYPDSGTAGRLLTGGLIAGGLGGGAAYFDNPYAAGTAGLMGAAMIPYSPGMRQALAKALAAERPNAVKELAPIVRALSVPAGGVGVPMLSNSSQQ